MTTRGTRPFSGADYLIFMLVLLGCVAAFLLLPPLGLSSNDEGSRHIQMKNFALFGTLPIEYPGQAAGFPAGDLVNGQEIFIERSGRLYITYPPLFTYLSSLAYPLVGDRVTTLLPLLAFLLCTVILAGSLKLLLQGNLLYYVLLFGFLLASPVYAFAISFVEHVPAVCLVFLSLYFLVRYFRIKSSLANLCLSASLLTAGVFFRPEVVLLAIPYTAFVSLTLWAQREVRKAVTLLACSLLPFLLYVLINCGLYGSTLLLHLVYHSLGLTLSVGQTVLALGALLLSGLLAYLARKGCEDPLLGERIYGFIPVLFIPVMLAAARSPVSALFLAFPLALLIFFGLSRRGEKLLSEPLSLGNILFVTVAGFLLLVSWPFADNGVGNVGYSLPVIPFVILFVAQEEKMIASSKPVAALVVALLLFSACFSAYSLKSVTWRYKQYNAERTAFLKAQTKVGDILIVDSQPLLEHLGPLFFERIFIVADSPCQLSRVVTQLKEKDIARVYLWAGARRFSVGSPCNGARPIVFSSTRGPENYLSSVTLVPSGEAPAGGQSPTLTSCSGRGSTPRLQ